MCAANTSKAKFLAEHPYCCFCGGKTRAVEEDHQPAKVFFLDRQWPEGFKFPACVRCNRASRDSENIVSLLTSHFGGEASRERYIKRRESVRTNFPEIIASLEMSSNEKRRAAKKIGVFPEQGQTFFNLPIVKINPKIWFCHFAMIGRKLALGLHYQCFQRPLPHGSAIYLGFHTNGDIFKGTDLLPFLQEAPQLVIPMRNNRKMGEQFAVRYGSSAEDNASLFVLNLHQRLVITALSIEDPSSLGGAREAGWVEQPFIWPDFQ